MSDIRGRTMPFRSTLLVSVILAATPTTASAQIVLWDESSQGELSHVQATPTILPNLQAGVNSVIGTVNNTGGVNPRDWFTITVPAGLQLTQYINAAFTSTDVQGFTGFQIGTPFVGSFGTDPTVYTGFSHFGTGAQNPGFSAFNSIGVDLLPIMNAQSVPTGAQGFTIPLQAGQYTFIVQQTGSALTSYRFDFVAAPVPEPSSMLLLGIGGVGTIWRRYRRR
jgi:hypothetical protein